MKILSETVHVRTKGQGEMIDLTGRVRSRLEASGLGEGQVTIFVVGSTAGVTTIEFEPGLVRDMVELYEKLAPAGQDYAHHATWGDDNGSSHVRAALQGPSLTVPFADGAMLLGTWQQIVLEEFDTRPRERRVVLQFIGSTRAER
ncbi:MAG: secondary thiamine-phosphate synthase enzyme YjbQ [Elusimicrobiota bacterium]